MQTSNSIESLCVGENSPDKYLKTRLSQYYRIHNAHLSKTYSRTRLKCDPLPLMDPVNEFNLSKLEFQNACDLNKEHIDTKVNRKKDIYFYSMLSLTLFGVSLGLNLLQLIWSGH